MAGSIEKGIGKRIMKLRAESGLNQERFAEAVGVSHTAVSNWEHGRTMPNVYYLRRMCDVFHVSADSIVYGKERG